MSAPASCSIARATPSTPNERPDDTDCQAGRKVANAFVGAGSTSLRSAARLRRRSIRSTPASHHCSPVLPGRSSPRTRRPVADHPLQHPDDNDHPKPVARRPRLGGERAVGAGEARDDVAERVGDRGR